MIDRHAKDTGLYAAIAGLTAAQTFVAAGEMPQHLWPYIGISLAVLLAVKMKRSAGKTEQE